MKRPSREGQTRAGTVGSSPGNSEAEEFERAMRDVVRLPDDRPDRVPPRRHVTRTSNENQSARSESIHDDATGSAAAYAAPGVDRRELRRLRRGEHEIRRRLDLHGLTAEDAVGRLRRFIDTSRHAGARAVCIVHGRGLHSSNGVAVLKFRVREVLRAHRAVLAFTDAPASDGGVGAVYVLLRK